jgi:uncharacterized protein
MSFEPEDFELQHEDIDLRKERVLASVIAAAGGELVGRVRLQKAVYILDQLGLSSGFDFEYHHYGPYSDELSETADFAKAFQLISEAEKVRNKDGARYSVFVSNFSLDEENFGQIGLDRARHSLELMNGKTATILELAATAHWLKHVEKREDWRSEILRRKGVKTESGRLDQALDLLNDLGLPVAV